MIKRDPKKEYIFPKDSLSSYSDYGLLIPFAAMNSTMRQHMWHSHIRQTIIPLNPERPLVDTRYTKDILFSSDNLLSKGKVTLKAKIEKKLITDYVCDTTYIYYDHSDGLHYIEKVPRYKAYSKYAYQQETQLDEMKIGDTKDKIYTKYISAMDTRDGGIAFGKNVNYFYTIDERVGEDSYVITKRLAESFTVQAMYTPDIVFNPKEEVLTDLYGFLDEKGIINYRPFPLPGEQIKNGVVAVVSKMAKDFLSVSDDEIHSSDISYFVHSGIVTDIEVYSNEPIESNRLLEQLRRGHMEYYQQIIHEISAIPLAQQSTQMKHYFERLISMQGNKLRFDKQELREKVRIRLKIVGEEPLTVGSKLTNRHGGKGTISEIIDQPFISEDGVEIDMKVNATGVMNRENVAQQVEQSLNVYNRSLMKYLKTSNDPIKEKFNKLIKWIDVARLDPVLIDTLKTYPMEQIIDHYANNEMYMKYDPFDENINWDWFLELTEYTMTLDPDLGPKTIYENGVPLGEKHVYGKAFYVVLENGPFKDTSIRSDKINTSKGNLTKVGLDKKKYHTKYLTTAVKQSDLSLNISISSQFESDRDLLSADLDQLDRRLNAMGIEIGLENIPEKVEE